MHRRSSAHNVARYLLGAGGDLTGKQLRVGEGGLLLRRFCMRPAAAGAMQEAAITRHLRIGQSMLYDLRETYIRPDRHEVRRPAVAALQTVGIWAAVLLASVALIYASLRFGVPVADGPLSAIYPS